MENLAQYTPTELLSMVNRTHELHETLKQNIIDFSIELDELEAKINEKLRLLDEVEKQYIELVEEINNR